MLGIVAGFLLLAGYVGDFFEMTNLTLAGSEILAGEPFKRSTGTAWAFLDRKLARIYHSMFFFLFICLSLLFFFGY